MSLVWFLTAALLVIAYWAKNTFAIDISAIINTLTGPLAGSSSSTTVSGLKFCIPWFVVIAAIIIAANIFLRKFEKNMAKKAAAKTDCAKKDTPVKDATAKTKSSNKKLHKLAAFAKRIASKLLYKLKKPHALQRTASTLCVFFLIGVLVYVNSSFQITRYFAEHSQLAALEANAASIDNEDDGSFYSKNYVDPDDVKITSSSKKKKNLIYIYVESLETSYINKTNGGAQDNTNYMPKLTKLAKENINFSSTSKVGGFHTINGATWTIAAIMAQSAGVPFALPVGTNNMDEQSSFCSGLTTLGDVLEDQGYTQEFLCGSDSTFAGRQKYFKQHGNYQIFDLYTARAKGYIPADYYDGWWGYEDEYLFEIAKDEATRLSSGDEPFNLTMLTVDLHHVGGKQCSKCGSKYSTNLENVVSCTDTQISEFIDWCQTQDWYENTTIVISGDHPRMDTQLVDGLERYDRTIYNCFINSSVKTKRGTKNRELTTVDMFPTTLVAMGYKIEGNRLGLGTNAFSNKETLAEKHGYDWLNDQADVSSTWYIKEFAPELMGLSKEE